MDKPHILKLPNEVLLEIMHQVPQIPILRRRNLSNMSKVCKRFRPIALEALLSAPLVHVLKIPSLLRMYFQFPQLASKVRTLEVTTECQCNVSEELSYLSCTSDFKRNRPEKDNDLIQNCIKAISSLDLTSSMKNQWAFDLQSPAYGQAYLGVILMLLPNMTELLLGAAGMADLPILYPMINDPEEQAMSWYPKSEFEGYQTSNAHEPRYSEYVLEIIGLCVQRLELPADWYDPGFPAMAPALTNLEPFTSLKCLEVPQAAILTYDHLMNPGFWILPKSLEILKISTNNDYYYAMDEYLKELVKARDHFPALRKIQVYCDWSSSKDYSKWRSGEDSSEALECYIMRREGMIERQKWASNVTENGLEVSTSYVAENFDVSDERQQDFADYLGVGTEFAWHNLFVLVMRGSHPELDTWWPMYNDQKGELEAGEMSEGIIAEVFAEEEDMYADRE